MSVERVLQKIDEERDTMHRALLHSIKIFNRHMERVEKELITSYGTGKLANINNLGEIQSSGTDIDTKCAILMQLQKQVEDIRNKYLS